MDLDLIGVNTAKKKQFATKGIYTIEDMLSYLPRKYKDFSKITGILPKDQISCVRAIVTDIEAHNAGSNPYVKASCEEIGTQKKITVFWFHMMWMYQQLRAFYKQEVIIGGKFDYNDKYQNYTVSNPDFFDMDYNMGIFPVYSSISGMSANYLAQKMQLAIQGHAKTSETLPKDIVLGENLLSMPIALQYIHSPKSMKQVAEGSERILLNDLLYFAINNELNRCEVSAGSQFNIKTLKLMTAIINSLPYKLTPDQQSSLNQMVQDAKNGRRLNGIVQADVGAGKSIIAALLSAAFIGSGYQAVIMAPTQVLAKQHFENFTELFAPHGVTVTYLDSSMSKKDRKKACGLISSGEAQMIVGTHSCIAKDVEYANLALTIVDEEHKFGVKQRSAIVDKAAAGVHSITMSATPIPRSLAQAIYGESIQLYTIKTMPSGRKPVITGIARDQEKIFRSIVTHVQRGRQAYVVCPMIDDNENIPNVKSVETVSKEYTAALSPYGVRVATLTGRDDKEKTEETIEKFRDREIDVLISTTVIEVGVNVPNATLMIIASADRFGLSGLHQLRGRVGRGDYQAYCALQSDATDEKAIARLTILCNSNDGFAIAEEDLKLRGAGNLLGTQQSGDNKYVSLMLANPDEYKLALKIAKTLIDRGMDCCPFTKRIEEERTIGDE